MNGLRERARLANNSNKRGHESTNEKRRPACICIIETWSWKLRAGWFVSCFWPPVARTRCQYSNELRGNPLPPENAFKSMIHRDGYPNIWMFCSFSHRFDYPLIDIFIRAIDWLAHLGHLAAGYRQTRQRQTFPKSRIIANLCFYQEFYHFIWI